MWQGLAGGRLRSRSPLGAILGAGVALLAGALPFAHEFALERAAADAMMTMPSISAGSAHWLIAAKIAVLTAVLLALGLRVARARGGALQRLAAAPLARSALLVAAVAGAGLAGFDECSSFGGAGMDDSGACHCWITAALCAIAALGTALSILTGRSILSALARAMRAVAVAFRWLLRVTGRALPPRSRERRRARKLEAGFSSRLGAGRAPPL